VAKKVVKRTKYQLEDNIKRVVFIKGGDAQAVPSDFVIPYATRAETEAGALLDKVVNPDTGGYAYDRLRKPGKHEAGKGTKIVTVVPDAGVATIDCLKSNVFEIELNAATTEIANPLNPLNAQTINIHLKQDPTGGRLVTFGTAWTFVNGVDPVPTTDGLAVDLLSCQWDPSAAKMRCAFLPNFGAGNTETPPPAASDLVFVNVGAANEVYRDRDGLNVNFRTFAAEGDIGVRTEGDQIIYSYTAPASSITTFDSLTDVEAPTPQVGDTIQWNGEAWVNVSGRRWTLGATWTNGPNALILPVNVVHATVSEAGRIISWSLLTDGAASGDCTVDIRRAASVVPPIDDTNSICAGDKPFISAGYTNGGGAPGAWDADCAAGDVIQFALEATDDFNTVQIVLTLERLPI
jgi:hypothetical protein